MLYLQEKRSHRLERVPKIGFTLIHGQLQAFIIGHGNVKLYVSFHARIQYFLKNRTEPMKRTLARYYFYYVNLQHRMQRAAFVSWDISLYQCDLVVGGSQVI